MRQTDLDKTPYFDDHNPEKRYYQVLFKAGATVQSRELNEMQDILLGQIESLGSHLFKNGSVVIPGNFSVKTKLKSISFTISDVAVRTALSNQSGSCFVRGSVNGVEAKVVNIVLDALDPSTVVAFYDVTKSGSNGVTTSLGLNEEVTFYSVDESGTETVIGASSVIEKGLGSYSTVDKGVYFIRGMLVQCETQDIVLNTLENVTTEVGFKILEEVITSAEDSDLFSNALGYPNFRVSGADRLRLTLTLTTKDPSIDDPDFLSLANIINGDIETLLSSVQYNELQKVLAQRTFEESGNYSVVEPNIEIKEHLNVDSNGGVYTVAQGGDESKLVAVISPSIHYVNGYRVENSSPKFIEVSKARGTTVANNSVTAAIYGYELEVKNITGVPRLDPISTYTLRTSGGSAVGNVKVFSSRLLSSGLMRLVVREIIFFAGKGWSDVGKITDGSLFSGDLNVKGLLGGDNPSLIFNLPYSGVKTLESSGSTDTTYNVTKDFSVTLNANGVGSISAPSGTVFTGNYSQFLASLASGAAGPLPVSYNLIGSPLGSGIEFDFGLSQSNASVRLMMVLQKLSPAPRTKTLSTTTQTLTVDFLLGGRYKLSNADVLSVKSITKDGIDITSYFTLESGQTDYSYEQGVLVGVAGKDLGVGSFDVEYTHYSHGPGDYFCVDSYIGVEYKDILPYVDSTGTIFDLRDCLDFRKTVINYVYTEGSIATPSSSIQSDIEYYLPKFNSLFVNSEGDFGSVEGVASPNPDLPLLPANSMKLMDLFVPSWTPTPESVLRFSESNKRYTMRDIGKLEKRIENVEYYTTLSLLESDVNSIQVIDPITGNDRFKNGIIADQFIDFRLFNPSDIESFASIDDTNSRLRPMVETIALTFEHVSGGLVKDDMVSCTVNAPIIFESQPFATKTINVNPYAVYSWAGFVKLSPSSDYWVDTIYEPSKIVNETVNTRGAAREGVVFGKWSGITNGALSFRFNQQRSTTTTEFTEWTSSSSSESVVRTQLIPFMRPINLTFNANGLRPFTRVYPWFGNVMIAAHCKPTNGALGGNLMSDSAGSLSGTFTVPNSSALRFQTGSNSFVLCDNQTDASDPNARTTFANVGFHSGGTLVTKQKTVVQTRVLGVTSRSTLEYRKVDPIAQSFSVSQSGGVFLETAEIFFAKKAINIPITLEIREMENGLPTHEVIGRVTLNPNQVNTSFTSEVATQFTFAPALYLKDGSEYAMVLLANTQEYEAYISEMGERVVGSAQTISVQPHDGVFFTSSNGSTWSPQQTQDLKFRLKRSNFNSSTQVATFRPNVQVQNKLLGINPLSGTALTTALTIRHTAHGARVGDYITLSGVDVGVTGVSSANLNKTHQITEVIDYNTVKVTLSQTVPNNFPFGGSNVISATRNIINLAFISVYSTVFENAGAKFECRYRQAATRTMSTWIEFVPNTDLLLPTECTYYDSSDFEIKVTMNSNTVLSPQIDLHGMTLLGTSFYVDATEELMAYVSRDVYLQNPSTSVRFYTGAMLPQNAGMKFYIKTITDVESDWIEIEPVNPIVNGFGQFVENEFSSEELPEFIGIRFKIVLTGSRNNPPTLRDVRGIVLA